MVPAAHMFLMFLLGFSRQLGVEASGQGNLAFGAETIQSTTAYNGYSKLAVDGNLDTDYHHNSCTHTALGKNLWWRVDFRRAYRITRITITKRGDCCAVRLNGARIHIGNSLENNGNNNFLIRQRIRRCQNHTVDAYVRAFARSWMLNPSYLSCV